MPSNKKLLQAAAGSAGESLYVEDVFSTFLYTGSSSNPITINNGIDFAGEGGLFWNRDRNTGYTGSVLLDTERGTLQTLATDQTSANVSISSNKNVTYNSNGISIQAASSTATGVLNFNGYNLCSWSFRKAEKFFDIVTWTGNGAGTRTVAHNLGVLPGMIIVKRTDSTSDWLTYNSNGSLYKQMSLNSTAANNSDKNYSEIATDSTLDVAHMEGSIGIGNANGATYVAYLFASDAGGFGDDGSESIIKCGSFNSTALNNLGWEPQWVLMKNTSSTSGWFIMDSMRGMTASTNTTTYNGSSPFLYANATQIETAATGLIAPAATGFGSGQGGTYIYMAIRRPMKTPTVGTEVYNAIARTGTGTAAAITGAGFSPDLVWAQPRSSAGSYPASIDRLRGPTKVLWPNVTSTEATSAANTDVVSFDMNGISVGALTSSTLINYNSAQMIIWLFKRATGFMDVVAYSGNGTAGATQAHNLGVVPEMLIVKRRNATDLWPVYHATLGNTKYLQLNGDTPEAAWNGNWNNTTPTASVFSLGNGSYTNANSSTYVAYLFASVAGVSKVGSYTGTGSSLDVPCGFTASARFILIRRYNYSSGGSDWYIYDSTRGISALGNNDPYLFLNTTAVEVTNTDYVASLSTGFNVTSNASSTINVNGGTYIFLAIA